MGDPNGFSARDRPDARARQLNILRARVATLESGSAPGGTAGVASFNGRVGAIALGLGDVVSALGFTPQPAGSYAATTHAHAIADVSGLQAALNAKQAAGSYALSSDLTWTGIAGKPSTFAPSAHTHPVSDVTGLQTALDGKQAAGSYASATHPHVIADVTGLQTALDGKQAAGSYAGTSAATSSTSGLMSATDKAKLDAIASGATANATDAQLRDRSTHTGSQAVGTITGLGAFATGTDAANLTGTVAAARLPAFAGGDVTSSAGSASLAIGANKVTRGMLAAAVGATILGATAAGNVADLTAAQAKTFLGIASGDVSGLGAFATGTDAANLTGTVASARLPAVVAAGAQGAMSGTDKTKLDGIATGATANSSDATLLNRANHTGTQAASTITGNTGGWTEKTLTADFSNSTVTFNTITDGTTPLTFTPPANSNWEAVAVLLIQTATATVLPEVGVSVSAQGAGSYGALQIDQTGATTATRVTLDGTWTTGAGTFNMAAGGVAAANTPYLCYVTLRGRSGASPAAITLTCASETAGTAVKVLTGSQLRFKTT
jgi:hypothetical protein